MCFFVLIHEVQNFHPTLSAATCHPCPVLAIPEALQTKLFGIIRASRCSPPQSATTRQRRIRGGASLCWLLLALFPASAGGAGDFAAA